MSTASDKNTINKKRVRRNSPNPFLIRDPDKVELKQYRRILSDKINKYLQR